MPERPAQGHLDLRADARGMGGLRGCGIVEIAKRRVLCIAGDERAQHPRRVRRSARAGVVLRVRDDDGLAGMGGQPHRFAHGIFGGEGLAGEIGFMRQQRAGDGVGMGINRSRVGAIGKDRRAAAFEIRRRKAHEQRGRGDPLRQVAGHLIQPPRGLHVGVLPADRDQVIDRAHRLGPTLPRHQHLVQRLGRAPAGFGHVDMRIGAEPDHDIGQLEHLRRDVSVQVQ